MTYEQHIKELMENGLKEWIQLNYKLTEQEFMGQVSEKQLYQLCDRFEVEYNDYDSALDKWESFMDLLASEWMGFQGRIEECIETLEENLFTNIKYTHKENEALFFTGYDTEEELDAIIQFEIVQENEDDENKTLFIYVKYSNSDHFIVHSWHYLED
ncbi:hypothetical protein V7128_02010 [Neobacillus vireti]|uniref:hypothetical protein n=1 Tax=Neobacillus vireti TaxID=220686 RepID=UPI002FFF5991